MNGFIDRLLPRAAALVAVWLLAVAVDREGNHWWLIACFLGIAMVLEFLAFKHGVSTGIAIYKSATPQQRADLDKILESDK